MVFGRKPRFELADDGTVIARAGTQTNCGGIAAIRVRIGYRNAAGIGLSTLDGADWNGGEYGPHVPGSAMPAALRDAVFEGAARAYEESGLAGGLDFVIIDATVHPVDANVRMFRAAGQEAVSGWISQSK